ncbi:MAG: hypothetical protein LBI99_03630 [Propionibacteriaceae bacterium]|jgi:hypothetical protein|nr:hypothetical protein [Propionibacteriaceae bacterium]
MDNDGHDPDNPDVATALANIRDGDMTSAQAAAASPVAAQLGHQEAERIEWEQVTGNSPEDRMRTEQHRAIPVFTGDTAGVDR